MNKFKRYYSYYLRLTLCLGLIILFSQFSFSKSCHSSFFIPDAPNALPASSSTTTSFLATWNKVSGAVDYRIDVSTSSSFSSFVSGYNDVTSLDTAFIINGLLGGQTYYYRVRTFDGALYSINSNKVAITTITDPPLLKTFSIPQTSSFRINWNPSNGATTYLLDVSNDITFSSFILENKSLTNSYYDVTGLGSCGAYYYRIRAVTSGASDYSITGSAFTICSSPTAQTPSSITSSSFVANWTNVPGATGYNIDVSIYPGFSSFISGYIDQPSTDNNITVSGLASGQTYYYRIRTSNDAGQGINSNTIAVTTLPDNPTAFAATLITGTSFKATWTVENGATEYRIDVSDDAFFSSFLPSYNNRQVLSNSISVTGLSASVTYYYRVRAVTPGGPGLNSNVITVLGAPIASAASLASISSFQANWNAAIGATSYRLDVATDNSFTNILPSFNDLTIASTSLLVNGLNAGETYYYRVRSINGSAISINSNVVLGTVLPAAPTAIIATGISQDRFTAHWNSSYGAFGYRIDIDKSISFTNPINTDLAENSTSVLIIGLDPGETYYYRVQSVNGGGVSSESNIISVITIPATPISTAASNVLIDGFTANWNSSDGAVNYLLDVSTVANFASFIPGYNSLSTVATNINLSSLSPGETYYYRVRANNGSGNSNYSANIAVTTITAAPVLLAASSVTTTKFKAYWSVPTGAESYLVDVAKDNLFNNPVVGYSGTPAPTNSLLVENLIPGTTYYYRVKSVNSSGSSISSSIGSITTVTDTPISIDPSSIYYNGFTANWNATSGASSYELDVSLNNTFTPSLPGLSGLGITGTSFAITGLTAGYIYYYRVRAINSGGASDNSNIINTITLSSAPSANPASSVTTSSFIANWGTVTGATSYNLDVATDPGFSTILTSYNNLNTTSTSYVISLLNSGTSYYYRVRADNPSGIGANSNVVSVVTIPPVPLALAATAVTATSFVANWGNSYGANDYRLDVSTNPGFTSFVGVFNNYSVASTSFDFNSLASGTSYYYRVKANNSNGESLYSNVIEVLTVPSAPVAIAASSINGSSFIANWSAVSGATEYRLDVSTNSSFSSFINGFNNQIVNTLSESVTGLVVNQTYYFRVRAVNLSGSSANSNTMVVPGAPIALTGTLQATTSFTANWNSVTDATGYRIDVSSKVDFSDFLPGYNNLPVAATSLSISGLSPGVNYYYRVRSISSGSISVNSHEIKATTLSDPPLALNASGVTNNSFDANWSSSTGATSYKLDVASDPSFASILLSYKDVQVFGNTFNISGLNNGQKYYYRVRAINDGGSSENSNIITIATIPLSPVAFSSSIRSTDKFTANWNSSSLPLSYEIEVATDNGFSNIVFSEDINNSPITTSIVITPLASGTKYYYRVRAVSLGGVSENSNIIEATTTPTSPLIKPATFIQETSFTANWDFSSGATEYRLDVSMNSDFSAILPTYNNIPVIGNAYNVKDLTEGTQYYFRVRAANGGGVGPYSGQADLTTVPKAPVAKVATSMTVSSFIASWNNSTGATNYKIDVSLDPAFNSLIGIYDNYNISGATQQLTVTGLEAGKVYYYRLRSLGTSGTSSNSNIITVTTVPAVPSGVIAVKNTPSGFIIKWNAVEGALGYKVDVSLNSSFTSIVNPYSNYNVNADSIIVQSLNPGTKYYFRVRAYATDVVSADVVTPSSTFTVPLAPVANAASAITTNGFIANWSAVSGTVTNYRLDISTLPDFSVPVSGYDNLLLPVSPLSKSISGLSSANTYYYRLRAENSGGKGANSNVIIIPGAPVAKKPTALSPNSFVANWDVVQGATSYKLEVFILPGGGTRLPGYEDLIVTSTSQLVTGISPGTSYSYIVRAVSSGVTGNYSNEIIAPTAPFASAASSVSETSFVANWNIVNGATEYRIDISKLPGFEELEDGYDNYYVNYSSLNALINIGVSPGQTYYYRVRAISSGGPSLNSNVISQVTKPAAPVPLAATNISSNSFKANWASSIGAVSYRLDVSESSSFSTFVGSYNNFPISSTSIDITNLEEGKVYYYRVRAVNAGGTSTSSGIVSVKTGTVIITAPTLIALCTNGEYAHLGDIVIAEGSNDVFNPHTDTVTLVLSAPAGFEFQPGVGSTSKIQGSDLSPVITTIVTSSSLIIKYLVKTIGGIEDAFKISGIKVKAVGSASSGKILRTGGTAAQAGNNVNDGKGHGALASNSTSAATIVGLSNNYCVNASPITLEGSPLDNDGSDGVVGVFSGEGVSGNVFDPAAAGTGLHTIYYTFTNLSGCTYTASKIVLVNPLPKVDFYLYNSDTSVCVSVASVPLNGTPSGGIFVGPNVGQNSSGGYVFFASQANPGANQISYKFVTPDNCETSITKNVYVNPRPRAGFQLSDACDGKTIVFTDTSKVVGGEIKSWLWNFGDGNIIDTTQHIQNPSHIYAVDGIYTVSLTVFSNAIPQCESSKVVQVVIGKTPKPSFQWENSCFGDFTRFKDITGIDNAIKERLWDFGDGTTSIEESPEHRFPAYGVYEVKLKIITNSNCSETRILQVPVYPYINTYPYIAHFENNDGWVPGGINSSWKLASPRGHIINKSYSGTKAWITDNDSSYNNNEKSYLEGPCFNLQGLSKPMVSFKIWIDTDPGSDGAVLQVTKDNGKSWEIVGQLNTGIGWYNSSPILGGPGGQQILGWSGRDLSQQWREAKINLDKYRQYSSVRFRISFGSSSENPANSRFNGIAVDDFWIGERSHTTVVEYFMNNELGLKDAIFLSQISLIENPEQINLIYHTDFPQEDPINLRNKADHNSRSLFYGITEIPTAVLDGNYKSSSLSAKDSTQFLRSVLKESRFNIKSEFNELSPNEINIKTKITALDTISVPLLINTAVVQRSTINGVYPLTILNKLLPDAAGTYINKKWSKDQEEEINLTWLPQYLLNNEQLGVIIFIQNKETKEVYQSLYKQLNVDPHKVTAIEEQPSIENKFILYPNPASTSTNLVMPSTIRSNLKYHIIDAVGKLVLKGEIRPGSKANINTHNLSGGIYSFQIYEGSKLIWIDKLIIGP